jgi:hypothetical protein
MPRMSYASKIIHIRINKNAILQNLAGWHLI